MTDYELQAKFTEVAEEFADHYDYDLDSLTYFVGYYSDDMLEKLTTEMQQSIDEAMERVYE